MKRQRINLLKTNNTNIADKIRLRIDDLETDRSYKIIDLFGGEGVVWNSISDLGYDVDVLRIDKEKGLPGVYLRGNNEKFLALIDWEAFDVIDLDAYNFPYVPLQYIFNKGVTGKLVFCTFATMHWAGMWKYKEGLLAEFGISKSMTKKAPTLFRFPLLDVLQRYLAKKGVSKIKRITLDNFKHYVSFHI